MSDSELSSSNVEDQDDLDLQGLILNKKYVIIEEIGKGVCSTVWFSYNITDDRFYALKLHNSNDYEDDVEDIEIVKKIRKIKSPYLLKLVDYFDYRSDFGKHMCTVFELKACSIDDVINVKDDVYSHGIPFDSAVRITYQLTKAVYALEHKCKMIHTDIKPENILICGISNDIKQLVKKFRNNDLAKKIKKKIARKKKITEYLVEKMIENVYDDNDSEYYGPVIDPKYIKKCDIVLGDFGTTIHLEEIDNSEIQTRHYRAPEVILGCDYDSKCDIWSIGCTFYEILTGDILFDPNKSKGINTDRQHIYDIQRLIGKIPSNVLERSRKKQVFFRKNGLMKRRTKIEYTPLKKFLEHKLKHKLSNSSQLNLTIDFLAKILVWDPLKRMSAKECRDHPIFNLFKK